MAKKKGKGLYGWQYYKNSEPSGYARAKADLYASPQFQELSGSAQRLYTVLTVHKETKEQHQNLQRALAEYISEGSISNADMKILKEGGEISDFDLNRIANDPGSNLFVFPAKHAEQYGFKQTYVSNIMRELTAAEFVSIYRKGMKPGIRRENIYRFSDRWKKMTAGEIRKRIDEAKTRKPER